ncbi:MAG: J domain-containing protein [Bacteroides sp.]|nr:J domain-containing protein [Bacteroides sp.]
MRLIKLLRELWGHRGTDRVEEYDNVVASIAQCKQLYKRLSILAHPDRNLDKVKIATELTEEINANRYNFSMLKRLEERVNTELL